MPHFLPTTWHKPWKFVASASATTADVKPLHVTAVFVGAVISIDELQIRRAVLDCYVHGCRLEINGLAAAGHRGRLAPSPRPTPIHTV